MNTISELTDYLGLEDLLEDKEKLEREITRNFDNEQVLPIVDKHAQEEAFPRRWVPKIARR